MPMVIHRQTGRHAIESVAYVQKRSGERFATKF